jgi:transcriptional regulator with XRE-family HTH domain
MIRSEAEYRFAIEQLEAGEKSSAKLRSELETASHNAKEIERALEPATCFQLQIREEIESYQRWARGDLSHFTHLDDLKLLPIAGRIARGLSQRELAQKLGVHESQVSRDERNEYLGVSVGRIREILDTLRIEVGIHGTTLKGENQGEDSSVPNNGTCAVVERATLAPTTPAETSFDWDPSRPPPAGGTGRGARS